MELGLHSGEKVIGFIARLVREKGIYEFLQAASILMARGVKARYLVIGTPQKGKKTAVSPEKLLRQYGVQDKVAILGYREDILELLSLMDVVVLPSFEEGIPRVLMESAAMGKPVVASRVRGNIEVVEDGRTGLLVPVKDGFALAEALESLIHDRERSAEMGRNARQIALRNFDERSFFWRTDLEYRRLLKARLAIEPDPILKPVQHLDVG
jgi:glycosyltransferase involved in cell wall biosynthesis